MNNKDVSAWSKSVSMKMRQMGLVNQLIEKFKDQITFLSVTSMDKFKDRTYLSAVSRDGHSSERENSNHTPKLIVDVTILGSDGTNRFIKISWIYNETVGWFKYYWEVSCKKEGVTQKIAFGEDKAVIACIAEWLEKE